MRTEGRVGCLKALAGTVGIIVSVIGGSVLAVVGLFVLVLGVSLDGCDGDIDPASAQLGVSGSAMGPFVVRVPSCMEPEIGSVRLVGPDRAVLWQADASPALALDEFTVGMAPPGFVETVPLSAQMDPGGVYRVQIGTGAIPQSTSTVDSTAASSEQLLGGNQVEFVPGSLVPDRILVGSELVDPDDFDTAACRDDE